MRLSILVPVYNERAVVETSLRKVMDAPLPEGVEREIILVDDCSTDGTSAILDRIAAAHPDIRLFHKPVNEGKGAAIRTAIGYATGDFCLVQDADLEYDPNEYSRLLRPLLDGHADAVFGSRYLTAEQTRVLPFWHSMINKTLTILSNMFCNLNLTDMETCYKVFRTDLLKSIPIRSNRFGFEPEITMKSSKRKLRIYEVPISYHGRTFEEGKKIGWKDGVKALGAIIYFWLVDDLYVEPYGRGHLHNITGTPQYVDWLTRLLRPHLGDRVVEVGAGIGNLAGRMMGKRQSYVAAEKDSLYLHALRNRFLRTPNVQVRSLDPEHSAACESLAGPFDTAIAASVLEFAEDPAAIVRNLAGQLAPGGKLLIIAPNAPGLYCNMDRTLGHKRRFDSGELGRLMVDAGLEVTSIRSFNSMGYLAWAVSGKLFGSRRLNRFTLKLFDKTVWVWRRIDPLMPVPGLTLFAVGTRP
ncbi:MAG TPA: bifunctional glycosyltransferase/class I SAM-dependent methyltransferase [Bryobacteraceae bacterium]|nr:bifunctional glycosyltransferase/class I SAM-dependent methyltransferase [Bryobacteraceae bacterium]